MADVGVDVGANGDGLGRLLLWRRNGKGSGIDAGIDASTGRVGIELALLLLSGLPLLLESLRVGTEVDRKVPALGNVQPVRDLAEVVEVRAGIKRRRVPKVPVGDVVLVKIKGLLLLLLLLLLSLLLLLLLVLLLRADAVTMVGIGLLVMAYRG